MRFSATLLLMAVSLSAPASFGALVSTAFDYQYEMATAPSSFDLDGNSIADFFSGTSSVAGDQLNNATYSGGVGSFNDDNTGSNSSVIRGDFTNSLWRANFLGDTTWTAEMSIRIRDDANFPEGSSGSLVVSGGIGGAGPIIRLFKDRIDFSSSSSGYTTYLSGTDFTSDFFVIRMARDAEGEGWLWINDNLVAQDQAPITGLGGGHANSFFIGGESFSSGVNGAWDIDYLRLDTDFHEAVPEPSPVILLLGGALMMLRVRRRSA